MPALPRISRAQFFRSVGHRLDEDDPLGPMQLQEGIGERSVAGAAVDYGPVFQPRKMPEVSVSAPILLIEERPELRSQSASRMRPCYRSELPRGRRFHLLPVNGRHDAGCELLHNGGSRVTRKYLATSPKGLIFKLKR